MIDKLTYDGASSMFRAALEVIFFLLMLYYWYFLISELVKKTNKHHRKIFNQIAILMKKQNIS